MMKQNTEQKAFSKIVNSDLKINKLFVNCRLKDTSNKTRIETSNVCIHYPHPAQSERYFQ